jgi:hypothetical protein
LFQKKRKRKRRNKAKLCSLAQPAVLCSLRPIIYVLLVSVLQV